MNEGILRVVEGFELESEHFATCIHVITHVGILLQFIQRGIPSFTDHGIMHSKRVLEHLQTILAEYPYSFNSEDKLILVLAAILHDIGCIAGRENHGETSVRILGISHLSSIRDLLSAEAYRFLESVIRAHSSSYDLSKLKNNGNDKPRQALLCAVFRLADECDVSSDRIPTLVLDVMKELKLLTAHELHIWTTHLEIESVYFEGNRVIFNVYDEKAAKPWIDKMRKELKEINSLLASFNLPPVDLKVISVPRSISRPSH